jgi:SAM-dependent methyltransferase
LSIPLITGFFYNQFVNPEIAARLVQLNHQFYQTFADSFSATRLKVQAGVRRIVAALPQQINLLDLGCGNGWLADYLIRYCYRGSYLGLDFSDGLLKNTLGRPELTAGQTGLHFRFARTDFSETDWEKNFTPNSFTQICSFAVFHHLPGDELRLRNLRKIRQLLEPDGIFVLSNWQFLNSPRLKARIVPWNRVGLTAEDVDEGDYILDWRGGPDTTGYRYVHSYSSASLYRLAAESGFTVREEFYSDGTEGNLGLYQVWTPS